MIDILICRADGGCRHIAAALHELDDFLKNQKSITEMTCQWVKKSRPNDKPSTAEKMLVTKYYV